MIASPTSQFTTSIVYGHFCIRTGVTTSGSLSAPQCHPRGRLNWDRRIAFDGFQLRTSQATFAVVVAGAVRWILNELATASMEMRWMVVTPPALVCRVDRTLLLLSRSIPGLTTMLLVPARTV